MEDVGAIDEIGSLRRNVGRLERQLEDLTTAYEKEVTRGEELQERIIQKCRRIAELKALLNESTDALAKIQGEVVERDSTISEQRVEIAVMSRKLVDMESKDEKFMDSLRKRDHELASFNKALSTAMKENQSLRLDLNAKALELEKYRQREEAVEHIRDGE